MPAEFAARSPLKHEKGHGSSLCMVTLWVRIDDNSSKWTSLENPSQNISENFVGQMQLTCIAHNPKHIKPPPTWWLPYCF
jgi:hypothetical protein